MLIPAFAGTGQAVVAMILNGLVFTNRRLYLTHQFFETKPVSRLLDADIEAKGETVPNQLGKEVQNPTMRWIFQIMEGIGIIRLFDEALSKPIKKMITNLNALRKKIIYHFGDTACRMYGLIQKSQTGGLAM